MRIGTLTLVAVVLVALATVAHAGPVTLVASAPGLRLNDITTDGTTLFVPALSGTAWSIRTAPIGGGSLSFLYAAFNPLDITVLGADLFWIDPNSGPITDTQILRAPKSGAGPVTAIYTGAFVGQPIVDGSGIETDGTKLYTADEVQGRVHSLNPSGSGLVQLDGARYGGFFSTEHLNTIAVGGGTLFIADSGRAGVITPGIYTIPATGGSFSTLFAGAPFVNGGPEGIAYGMGTVYVVQGTTIYSMPATGGPLTAFTSPLFTSLAGITFHAGALYVTDNTPNGGHIWRVDLIPEPSGLLLLGAGLAAVVALRRRSARR
ncbi:MAG: PEP-CTERM sorting domain-containing protein [Planctomycetota bacterium]|jgi:hypothetical protein